MKIISTSITEKCGVIEISTFEIGVIKKALENFRKRVREDQYESIIGATTTQIEILIDELRYFMYEIPEGDLRARQRISTMKILEFNQVNKCVTLKLSCVDARAFYNSLTNLWLNMSEGDCHPITGLYPYEIEEVTRKLDEIYTQIA